MAVTQKSLRSVARAHAPRVHLPRRMFNVVYGATLLLAAVAVYLLATVFVGKAHVLVDDVRYGRPRTTQVNAFVGHDEASGQPTHILALNLNRQITLIELPGGDASKARTIVGPYLFGADEDLTTPFISLRDADGDRNVDLVLDIRNEQLIFLNKDGAFRLPKPEEQSLLSLGSDQ